MRVSVYTFPEHLRYFKAWDFLIILHYWAEKSAKVVEVFWVCKNFAREPTPSMDANIEFSQLNSVLAKNRYLLVYSFIRIK